MCSKISCALAQHQGSFVFTLFGSPYLLNYVPELPSYALAYEFYPGAEAAMVRAIFGEIEFTGKLPVTVANFAVGSDWRSSARPALWPCGFSSFGWQGWAFGNSGLKAALLATFE